MTFEEKVELLASMHVEAERRAEEWRAQQETRRIEHEEWRADFEKRQAEWNAEFDRKEKAAAARHRRAVRLAVQEARNG